MGLKNLGEEIESWGGVNLVRSLRYDEKNFIKNRTNLSSHQPLVLSVSALTEIFEAGTVPLSIRPSAIA